MSALGTALAEGESKEALAAMVVELRRTVRHVVDEIDAIHKAYGAPGDYGYGTDLAQVLLQVYRLAPVLDDALKRLGAEQLALP